jgi:hypothetical protein
MPDIAVVYLEWKPYGELPAQKFHESYRRFEAGVSHDLKVLQPTSGLDIATYLEFATYNAKYRYCCFLSSHSRILADKWLWKMAALLRSGEVGLVGATASAQSLDFKNWPPFPNYHIRSTGFLIERELLLSFGFLPPRTKKEIYEFESGPECLSKRIWNLNLSCLLVGRDGLGYAPPQWKKAHAFRSGKQENLLIADNRTEEYQQAEEHNQKWYEELTWG